jgi:hypothetical protein
LFLAFENKNYENALVEGIFLKKRKKYKKKKSPPNYGPFTV